MIIPLNKLLVYGENRYRFTRACMETVEKIGNLKMFPEDDTKWKVVPNILRIMLDEEIQFRSTPEEQPEEKEGSDV